MNLLSLDEIKALSEKQGGLSVSFFMPTHRMGSETQQNQIRFKNLLKKAEDELVRNGMRSADTRDFLKPAQDLLNDLPFWRNQRDGLSAFLSPGYWGYFRLPMDFRELLVVSDRFHLKPLVPMLSGNVRFYILALSLNQIRVIACTRFSAPSVEIEDLPENMEAALNLDDFQKRLQRHAGTEDTKNKILLYFQEVDRALRPFFRDRKEPLLFAGVDYLFPLYREANTYAHLYSQALTGNHEELSQEELLEDAWPVVEPFFEKERVKVLEQFYDFYGTGRASSDLEDVVKAAAHARVAALFVALGVQTWGYYDFEKDRVVMSREARPGTRDLLDFATIETLVNGGVVYAVSPREVPEKAPLAAVFRY